MDDLRPALIYPICYECNTMDLHEFYLEITVRLNFLEQF